MSDRIVVDTATLEKTGKQLRRLQQNLQDLSNQLDRIDLTRDSGGRLAFEAVQKLEFSGMRVAGENVDETINAYRQGLKETGRHAEKLMRTLRGLQDDIEQLENRLRAQVERLNVGEVAFGAEPVVEGTSLGVEAIVPNVFQPLSYHRPVTQVPYSVGAQALQQVADAMGAAGATIDSAHAEFVPLMHDRPGLNMPDYVGAGATIDSAHAEFVPLMHERPGMERPHGGAGASFDTPSGSTGSGGGHRF